MTGPKKTVVLGASGNPARYSYLAVNKLRAGGHPVIAIGNRPDRVGDVIVITDSPDEKEVDTVTIYLNARNQKAYYDYVLSLHPRRILFNPGTENPEFAALAVQNGIVPVEACTLVLLGTGQY